MCEASLPFTVILLMDFDSKTDTLPFKSKNLLTIIAHVRLFSQNYIANLQECRVCVCVMVKGLVARSHSLLVFFIIYLHSYKINLFIHIHS